MCVCASMRMHVCVCYNAWKLEFNCLFLLVPPSSKCLIHISLYHWAFRSSQEPLMDPLHCNFPFFLLLCLNKMSSVLLSTMTTSVLPFPQWTMITRFVRKYISIFSFDPLYWCFQVGVVFELKYFLISTYIRLTIIFFLNTYLKFKIN